MIKLKHIALATFTLFIVGCSNKKDTNVLPEIYLVTDVATFVKNEANIKKDLSEWFAPFKEQEICPNVRIYPQVRVILIDTDPMVSEKIISTNPKSLVASNQNFVQKVFGAKPKFEKLIDLARESINTIKIPDSVIASRSINPTTKDIGKIQADFTLHMSKYGIKNSKYTILDNDPKKFRAAIATSLCKTAKDIKDAVNAVLIDYGSSIEVPQPPIPALPKPPIPRTKQVDDMKPTIVTPIPSRINPETEEAEGKRTAPHNMTPLN